MTLFASTMMAGCLGRLANQLAQVAQYKSHFRLGHGPGLLDVAFKNDL